MRQREGQGLDLHPPDVEQTSLPSVKEKDPKKNLLIRHKNGDRTAFPEFVQEYRARVYGYMVRCGIQRATCDDLFQEAFLAIHKNISKYDPQYAVAPWVFTIVANTVRSHFRRERAKHTMEEKKRGESSAAPIDPHAQREADETARWLDAAITELPEEQREAVLLCCIKDLQQSEVAKMLKIPLNTLKTHIHRARLSLAKGLLKRNESKETKS